MEVDIETQHDVWNCTDQEWHEYCVKVSMFSGPLSKAEEDLPRRVGSHEILDRVVTKHENYSVVVTRWQRIIPTMAQSGSFVSELSSQNS